MVEPPHRGSSVHRVSGATPQMQPTLPSDTSKAASLCACACWEVVAGRRQGVGSDWSSHMATGAVSPGKWEHTQAVLRIHKEAASGEDSSSRA